MYRRCRHVIQSIPQHPSYSEKRRQHPKRPNIIDKSREKWHTLGYAHPPISIIQDMQPVETKEVGRKQHSTGDPTPAPCSLCTELFETIRRKPKTTRRASGYTGHRFIVNSRARSSARFCEQPHHATSWLLPIVTCNCTSCA